jgi:hypothetical protein
MTIFRDTAECISLHFINVRSVFVLVTRGCDVVWSVNKRKANNDLQILAPTYSVIYGGLR